MSDRGSVYNCKNHQNYRWWDTKPNGNLIFAGEIVRLEETGHKVRKESAFDPMNPMRRLKMYVENKNPFAPSLPMDPPITWERIVQFVESVQKMEALGHVFECACPLSDLVRLPDETYETLHALPVWKPEEAKA